MKTTVLTSQAPPPPQRVILDLSVEEFAAIYRLYSLYLDGSGAVRNQIRSGLEEGLACLDPKARERVLKAAGTYGNAVAAVEAAFRA